MTKQDNSTISPVTVWLLLALVFVFLTFVSSLYGVMARPQAERVDRLAPRIMKPCWHLLTANQEGELLYWRRVVVGVPSSEIAKELQESKLILCTDSVYRFSPVKTWHYEYVLMYCGKEFRGRSLTEAVHKYIVWYNSKVR